MSKINNPSFSRTPSPTPPSASGASSNSNRRLVSLEASPTPIRNTATQQRDDIPINRRTISLNPAGQGGVRLRLRPMQASASPSRQQHDIASPYTNINGASASPIRNFQQENNGRVPMRRNNQPRPSLSADIAAITPNLNGASAIPRTRPPISQAEQMHHEVRMADHERRGRQREERTQREARLYREFVAPQNASAEGSESPDNSSIVSNVLNWLNPFNSRDDS